MCRPSVFFTCVLTATVLFAEVISVAQDRRVPGSDSVPVVVDRNVEARMRDGAILRADVYRPDAPGRHPALIHRTPYSKRPQSTVQARPQGLRVFGEDAELRRAGQSIFHDSGRPSRVMLPVVPR